MSREDSRKDPMPVRSWFVKLKNAPLRHFGELQSHSQENGMVPESGIEPPTY